MLRAETKRDKRESRLEQAERFWEKAETTRQQTESFLEETETVGVKAEALLEEAETNRKQAETILEKAEGVVFLLNGRYLTGMGQNHGKVSLKERVAFLFEIVDEERRISKRQFS